MIRAVPAQAVVAIAAAALLAGCATDRLTLLENEPGQDVGAVAVIDKKGRETLVDRANSEAALRSGPSRVRQVKELRPEYASLIGTLPPKATAFVIKFPVNSSEIPVEQRGVLELIRNELSVRPGAQIEVAGFTDSTGEDDLNDRISAERAKAVAEQLRGFGFPVDDADAVGRGEDEAKAKLGDNVQNEEYRRVEVIVR